jgi:hypothetical protein
MNHFNMTLLLSQGFWLVATEPQYLHLPVGRARAGLCDMENFGNDISWLLAEQHAVPGPRVKCRKSAPG